MTYYIFLTGIIIFFVVLVVGIFKHASDINKSDNCSSIIKNNSIFLNDPNDTDQYNNNDIGDYGADL